jgi:DNA-directed RNA polymerase subunit omega
LGNPQEKLMARITVEDCLKKVNNRFALIHMAAKRVRQLRKGQEPLVASKNRDVVISLREIAAGKVFPGESVLQESSVENVADIPPEEEKKAAVKKKAPKKGKGK